MKFANRFLSLITRFALVEVAIVGIAALPSQAATLSSSQGTLEFSNFSQTPLDTQTLTDTNSLTIAEPTSLKTADTLVEEAFTAEPSLALSEGKSVSNAAKSQTKVVGNFSVEANQTFSFDFAANLDLKTSVDDSSSENTSASGDLAFFLVDTQKPTNVYDYLAVSGKLTTPGTNDFLSANNSDNLSFKVNSFTDDFDGPQESASAVLSGSLTTSFEKPTSVTLIEAKANYPSAAVPESESAVALVLFLGFIGIKYKARKTLGAR